MGIFQVGIYWVGIFLMGIFHGGSLMGGNFPGGGFPDTLPEGLWVYKEKCLNLIFKEKIWTAARVKLQ